MVPSGIDDRHYPRHLQNPDRWGLQSGSTITQQLAKEALLTQEQTIRRKVADMILAIQLERRYTKKEILSSTQSNLPGARREWCGNGLQYYFGKSARDVSFSEAALLAGLTQNPAVTRL